MSVTVEGSMNQSYKYKTSYLFHQFIEFVILRQEKICYYIDKRYVKEILEDKLCKIISIDIETNM